MMKSCFPPLFRSDFKPWKKTKVIIHGFVKGSDVDWMEDMTNELLIEGDYNVITIDWRPGVIRNEYDEAVGNVRVVGAEVALLLNMIQVKRKVFLSHPLSPIFYVARC